MSSAPIDLWKAAHERQEVPANQEDIPADIGGGVSVNSVTANAENLGLVPVVRIEQLLDSTVGFARVILRAEKCSFMTVAPDTGELVIDRALGLSEDLASRVKVNLGDGVAGWVALNRKSLHIESDQACPEIKRCHSANYATQSFISVPVFAGGDVVGVLNVADKRDGSSFGTSDLALLEHVASFVSELLTTKDSLKALEATSLVDALTGLGNLRQLDNRLAQELARARRYDQQVSLMLIDIDRFGAVNDICGYDSGNQVLRGVGQCIEQAIRRSDLVVRFGGDEFAVVLPQTGESAAEMVAERLVAGVSQLPLPETTNALSTLSISIGISCYPTLALDGEQLINQAQVALDLTKTRSSHRIMIWRQLSDQVEEARRLGIPYLVDPAEMLTPELAQFIPLDLARRHICVPVGYQRGKLTVAMLDATDTDLLEKLVGVTHLSIHPVISSRARILLALNLMSELLRKPAAAEISIRKTPNRGRELHIVVKALTPSASIPQLIRRITDICVVPGVHVKRAGAQELTVSASAISCSRLFKALRQVDDLLIESVKAEDPTHVAVPQGQ